MTKEKKLPNEELVRLQKSIVKTVMDNLIKSVTSSLDVAFSEGRVPVDWDIEMFRQLVADKTYLSLYGTEKQPPSRLKGKEKEKYKQDCLDNNLL